MHGIWFSCLWVTYDAKREEVSQCAVAIHDGAYFTRPGALTICVGELPYFSSNFFANSFQE
jgi:hypothetical protein